MKSEERLLELPAGYVAILADLKDQIRAARLKAGLAVNRELVLLYWRIGRQIVEMKWWNEPLGVSEVSPHLVRVYNRGQVGGIIISASDYTEPAITVCKDALHSKVVVLCKLEEIVMLLEKEIELRPFLRSKINAAKMDKNPMHEPLKWSD